MQKGVGLASQLLYTQAQKISWCGGAGDSSKIVLINFLCLGKTTAAVKETMKYQMLSVVQFLQLNNIQRQLSIRKFAVCMDES